MSIEAVGLMASIAALIVFISPLDQIRTILKFKKSDEVSPALYMAMIVNCSLWTIYGMGINNWFILVPNAVGMVLGAVTLFFIFKYR
ncbi:SemiSWEET family sugar transporter [Methanobacterium alcaliphilum]|uniref:SemiSWEET family sugar transporter n=1 Tax=Methanobacterium alcaliphilum TaxID=392018 RepID=UPI00200A5FF0|nr:SWEET family sugar transporter [Methanobacterium alcaliphilum]MCK9151681.1 SWEET family sugar transporter [Methanobacterium alcaliphilum]